MPPLLVQQMLVAGLQDRVSSYLVAGFFGALTITALILLHILGSRLFVVSLEKGRTGPILMGAIALAAGIAGLSAGAFMPPGNPALLVGLASGFLVWTALGEVAEQLGWVSTLSRSAVPTFLPIFALWLAGFLVREIPVAIMAGTGYPVCIWGLHLARVRVIAKWGPESMAATVLALANAAIAGGGIALGMSGGTPLTGIIGGVVCAMATWSTLEIFWERGTASRPWRH